MNGTPIDTDADALDRMDSLYRRMSPIEKLARVRDLTLLAHRLALARLRELHPAESEGELLLRLARRRLGDEIVARAYGSPERSDGA